MKTLIIYDNEGYVISTRQGQPLRIPVGVPFIYEIIPEGKKLINGLVDEVRIPQVDVTVEPHQLILEDIPPTEFDLLRMEAAESNFELMMLISSLGGM